MNDRHTKVHVFRHPRYNRKERLTSLAIRRKSVVQSYSARLTANFLKERQNHVFTGRAPSSSDQDSQNPAVRFLSSTSTVPGDVTSPSIQTTWVNQKKNQLVAGILGPYNARNGVTEAWDPVPYKYILTGNPYGHERSVNHCQSADTYISSSLPPLDLDDADPPFVTMPVNTYPPEQCHADSKMRHDNGAVAMIDYEGWRRLTENENHDELQGGALLEIETNWRDPSCPQATVQGTSDTPLTEPLQVSSTHFSTICSEFSEFLNGVDSELENILDDDILESIFD